MPVVRIDGRPIGNGKPGPVATALRRDFIVMPRSAEVCAEWRHRFWPAKLGLA